MKRMLSAMSNDDLRAQLYQNCTDQEFRAMDSPFYRKDAIVFLLARFETNFAAKWKKVNGFPFELVGGRTRDFLPYLPVIYYKILKQRFYAMLDTFKRKTGETTHA